MAAQDTVAPLPVPLRAGKQQRATRGRPARATRANTLTFDEEARHEVRRIEHCRRHLAVSRRALPLICELRREAERQNIEIHFLRGP